MPDRTVLVVGLVALTLIAGCGSPGPGTDDGATPTNGPGEESPTEPATADTPTDGAEETEMTPEASPTEETTPDDETIGTETPTGTPTNETPTTTPLDGGI